MSKRSQIVNALVEKLKDINGTGNYNSNLFTNVENKLKFLDEISDYPSVYVTAGHELREYLPGGFKWAHLAINIRVYVDGEDPALLLEEIFEDIEKIVDESGNLIYNQDGSMLEDLKIKSINTDEGLLAPIGIGEINLQVMYDLQT